MRASPLLWCASLLLLLACDGRQVRVDPRDTRLDAATADSGAEASDAGTPADSGTPPMADAGTTSDAGTEPDAGTPAPDAGTAVDAGGPAADAGGPAPDAGALAPDAGGPAPDAGGLAPDAGGLAPDAGSGPGALPAPVGFIIQEISGRGAYPICVATLIAPNRAVTQYRCIATSFVGPGGETATGTNFFARPADVGNRSAWVEVNRTIRHQYVARLELTQAVPGASVASLPSGPLAASDVGQSFVAPHVVGRDVDGNVPAGTALRMIAGTTTVRALDGLGLQAVFPHYDGYVRAAFSSFETSFILQDGPLDITYAGLWQRPNLGNYEVVTAGANEAAMAGGDIDTRGAPLLRDLGGGSFELVGIYKEAVASFEPTNRPHVLASYYAAMTPDVLSILRGGAPSPELHCGDVVIGTPECRNGWALTCDAFFSPPSIDPITGGGAHYCGPQSNCQVTRVDASCLGP